MMVLTAEPRLPRCGPYSVLDPPTTGRMSATAFFTSHLNAEVNNSLGVMIIMYYCSVILECGIGYCTKKSCISRVGDCIMRQVFELCESMNAVGAVLDVHKLLDNRKASSESKVAGLDALGEISKAAGALVD